MLCLPNSRFRLFIINSGLLLSLWFGFQITRVVAQSNAVALVSAASFRTDSIAPETIVAAFGNGLATQNATGGDTDPNTPGVQLPTTLAGTSVRVNGQLAGLFFVSVGQVNFEVPASTALGTATVVVTSGTGQTFNGTMDVKQVAPAIFSANANGEGVPAAVALRVRANGQQLFENVATFNQAANRFNASPLDLGPEGERVFLVLFLSGIRRAPDPDNNRNVNEFVRVIINGLEVIPDFAGKQGGLLDVDQINVEVPRGLLGSVGLDVIVSVNGFGVSNTTRIELTAPAITALNWRPLGLANRIIRQFATVGSLLYAATNQGVFCSSDNGINWIGVNTGLPANASILTLIANGSVLYAGLQGGGCYISINGGQLWTALNAGLSGNTLTINYLLFFGPTLYAATAGGVCVFNNNQWQLLINGLSTLDSATLLVYGGRLCVGTRGGGIFLLNGTQWGTINTGLPTGAQVLSFANAGAAVYAGLQGAGLCVSRNNGQSWTLVGGGLPANITVYWIVIDGTRYYVATNLGIYVSNDSGATWVLLSTGLTNTNIFTIYAIASRLLVGSNGAGVFGAALAASNANRVPVAYAQSVATDEDTARAITLSGLDLDLDPVNYFIQTPPANGTLTGVAPNVTYTPRANFNGTDRFTFIVTDGRGGTSPAAEVSILVNPVNDPPVVTVQPSFTVTAGQALSFTVNATDVDGDALTLTTSTLPAGASFNANTRLFTWTPTAAGTYQITFTANDGKVSASAGTTITVNAAVVAWQPFGTGINGINRIWCFYVSGTTIYAGGDLGIWRSLDSGANWANFSNGLEANARVAYRFAFINGKLYTATSGGLFVLGNDATGPVWVKLTNGLPAGQFVSVAGVGQTIFAGSQGNGTYRSTDGGATFSLFGSQAFGATAQAVQLFIDGDYVLAGGYGTSGAGLYRSLASSANWTYINSFGLDFPTSFQRVNNTIIAGGSGYLYFSTDGGVSWTRSAAQAVIGQFYNFVVAEDGIYAAGTGGGVVFTNNNANTWTSLNQGITSNQTIGLIRDGARLLLGGVNTVFTRPLSTTGNRPPALTVPGTQTVATGQSLSFSVSATDPDAGQTVVLSATNVPQGASFNANSGQFTWTPGAAGTFTVNFTATDNGSPQLSDTRTVTITVTGGGGGGGPLTFSKVQVGQGIVRSMAVHNSAVYAGLLPGGIFRSTDNGATFTPYNNGFGTNQPLALAGKGSFIFCAANNGVYRSPDNGANWTQMNTGLPNNPPVFSLLVSGNVLYAGVASNGVYKSVNDGASWTPANIGHVGSTPLAFQQFGTNLFAGFNSAGVYRSLDNAAQWTQVNGGLPQNARNITQFALLQNTLYTAAFVQGGVFTLTGADGTNWTQAGTGLPTAANSVLNGIAAVGNNLFVNPLVGNLYRATHPNPTWTEITGTGAPTNVYTLIANGNYLYAGDGSGFVFVAQVQ